MDIVCLDLEGVLVPEIWIAFAEASGIPELKRTTRDEPDYDKLMTWRLGILKEHGLGLKEIQDTIATIDPIPGAKEFLDELRSITQVIIISDTFTQFASPLMKKLGWPTIFCNSLEVAPDGEITGFKMRCEKSKYTTVKALQSIGYDTIASGDSHNDLGMIEASKAGFLFKSTDQIKADHPELPAYETYDELLAAIKKVLGQRQNLYSPSGDVFEILRFRNIPFCVFDKDYYFTFKKIFEEIIKEKGWIQISDEGAIKEVVMKILENNPQSVADFKGGKDKALGFLVGQAMKETKGKANPQMLNKMFLEELNKQLKIN